jgi:hypothetical protein
MKSQGMMGPNIKDFDPNEPKSDYFCRIIEMQ